MRDTRRAPRRAATQRRGNGADVTEIAFVASAILAVVVAATWGGCSGSVPERRDVAVATEPAATAKASAVVAKAPVHEKPAEAPAVPEKKAAAALREAVSKTPVADPRSWTLVYDFNDGAVGEKVARLDAGGGTRYTAEQSYEGGKGAVLSAKRGRENYGRWGGRVVFPERLRKGDEIWWRVRTRWPKGMDYSANPRLKFLRIHTCSAAGKNHGYNDIYINPPGSKVPFQFIYEGGQKWTKLGGAAEAIVPDVWETYEYYVKLDDVAVADGGSARVRFWKNGKLVRDITDRKTLKTHDDYADSALLFTYWNSSPYMGQIVYEGGGPFELKETVSCGGRPDVAFRVERVAPGAVYLIDPERDWRKRVRPWSALKKGEKLTGRTSGDTCVVSEVLHSHPLMDITMYVDDMVLTTATPRGRDAAGNPVIGK